MNLFQSACDALTPATPTIPVTPVVQLFQAPVDALTAATPQYTFAMKAKEFQSAC